MTNMTKRVANGLFRERIGRTSKAIAFAVDEQYMAGMVIGYVQVVSDHYDARGRLTMIGL